MNLFVETLLFIVQLLYLLIKGVIVACLPASLFRKKDVSGEKVLITGSGSGLGRLMALEFAKLKCTLILWDVNAAGNEETARMVEELGVSAHPFTVDLSDKDAIYSAAAKTKESVGDVDILINNAGIVTGKKLMDCPDNLMLKTMDVNVNAHFWTLKAFLPSMMSRNHGHIVNIASAAGLFGVTGLCDYCASKFAAVGLDESLRNEIVSSGKSGVKTTVICPYYIKTGMFEGIKTKFPLLLPFMEPEYVINKIVTAVLTNQTMVLLPPSLNVMYALKGLLPADAQLLCNKFFGISSTMDEFKGRQKQE